MIRRELAIANYTEAMRQANEVRREGFDALLDGHLEYSQRLLERAVSMSDTARATYLEQARRPK